MPQRVIVFAVVGLLAFGALGYLAFAKISELEDQVASLDGSLSDTQAQLDQTEARASAASQAASSAQQRAERAERRAATAETDASEAADRAMSAEERAQMSDAERQAADEARVEAERAREVAEMESAAAQDLARSALDSEARAREEAKAAREEAALIRLQREEEMNRMQAAMASIVETRRTAVGVVLNLGDRVEFEFDQSVLRPQERELLARVAGVLIATAGQGYAIQVFGHTDDVGNEEYNQGLSERRAQAVMDYLIESGVDESILSMQGMGKSMPLVAETTEEARARNRRVEIAIVDTLIDFKPGRD